MAEGPAEPVRLGETLERYLRFLGRPPVSITSQLAARWAEVVGPVMAANTRPIEVRDGTLVIGCDEAAWAAQIGWMERQILAQLRGLFGESDLTRVVSRIGR